MPPASGGPSSSTPARAYREALPAVWSDADETVTQSFIVYGAVPDAVARALYATSSPLVARVHRERGHTALAETLWSSQHQQQDHHHHHRRRRQHDNHHHPLDPLPPAGATRSLRFQSPSPAPAISPGPCWNDDEQRVLWVAPSSSSPSVYVVQSDVRAGVPYGDAIAVLARTCLADVSGGSGSGSGSGNLKESEPATLVRVSYCVRYGPSLPRLVRGMVARGVDGGVRPTYAAIRAALPEALGGGAIRVTDVPPSAPLPPALRAALKSLASSPRSAAAAGERGAAAAATRPQAAAAVAITSPATATAASSPSLLLLEHALLPPASAARALVELVGDPLLFARAAAGLITLAVLAVAVRATHWLLADGGGAWWCLGGGSVVSLLLHPPESTAQALTGALLLMASNRFVDALLSVLASAAGGGGAAKAAGGGAEAATATTSAEGAESDGADPTTTSTPTRARIRGLGSSGTAAAADMAAELAAATATRLRTAADKARTSVAAQLRPRASGGGPAQQQLLRETQIELEAEASRRLRQRHPPTPRPPDEQATAALLLGGAPLTVVEDYVSTPAAGDVPGALAPVDLLYERPPKRPGTRPRSSAGEVGATAAASGPSAGAAATRSSSSPPPVPRSPSLPTASGGGGGGSGSGPMSVKGKAWSSTSLANRGNKAAVASVAGSSDGRRRASPLAPSPSPPPPPPPLALLDLALLPDGNASAAIMAAVAQQLPQAPDEQQQDDVAAASDGVASRGDNASEDDNYDDDEPPLRELFENERRQAWGWGHAYPGSFLPSDRIGHWSDREGRPGGNASSRPSRVSAAHPPDGWAWAPGSRWRLDVSGRGEGAVDIDGWAYAVDFPQLLALHSATGWPPPAGSGKMTGGVFVRRRRWVRALVPAAARVPPSPLRAASAPSPSLSLHSPPSARYVDSSDEEEEEEEQAVGCGGDTAAAAAAEEAPEQRAEAQTTDGGGGGGAAGAGHGAGLAATTEAEALAAPLPPPSTSSARTEEQDASTLEQDEPL
jgi:hypothetical protein